MLIIGGILPIVGRFLASIPAPIMGGLYVVLFGMILGVGLRYTAKSDLNSLRNVAIVGASILLGLALPSALANPEIKDSVLKALES